MVDPKETTETVEDTEGTQVQEDSAEKQDASNDTGTEEEKAEAPEQEEKTPEDADKEESLEEKAKRYGQSMADKALKTYQQKLQEQNKILTEKDKMIADLTLKVNEKEWDKATKELFEEESETKGEDVAARNKAHREALRKQVLEYQSNAEKVKQTVALLGEVDLETHLKTLGKATLAEAVDFLDGTAKMQKARELAWSIEFPEDKEKIARIKNNVDRLMKAQDQDHFNLIADSIKAEIKGTKARQTFSGSRQEGSGKTKLTLKEIMSMSPEEKFKRNAEINKFFEQQE